MRKAKALGIFSAALILGSFPVLADQAPDALPLATIANEPLLVSADMREGTELSGTWHYSIDPYRAGIAGFHGETPDRGSSAGSTLMCARRWRWTIAPCSNSTWRIV
jgi:beta-glucuronidase